MTELKPPFEAFNYEKKDDPFVFASYAHSDKNAVYPLIKRLHDDGINIWYDEGIPPSSEWRDKIAHALANCDYFIVFITKTSVSRPNVVREINFSLNRYDKGAIVFLPVYLENMTLPDNLEFSMGGIQALMKDSWEDDVFYSKLLKQIDNSKIILNKKEEVEARLKIEIELQQKEAEEKRRIQEEEQRSRLKEKLVKEEKTFEAIQKYESALDIMERNGEEFEEKIIELLTIITESCLKSEHDNLAIEYADKLKEKAENLGDLFQMGNADYFKGIALIRKKEVQQGLTTLKDSAIFFEKTEDFAGVGQVNRLIGNLYLQNNDFCSAGLFYMETIKNYNLAIQKFHPKRNTPWSLPQKLEESVEQLKTKVLELIEKMDDNEIIEKIRLDLKSI